MQRSASTAYPEPASGLHDSITEQAWKRVKGSIPDGFVQRVLDVGSGSGLALDLFTKERFDVYGLTCVDSEYHEVSRRYPGKMFLMDMHQIGIWNKFWDLIWMRHVAEHSPAPSFLLSEAHDAMVDGGYLYLEVPNPDTLCLHESNPDHQSILGYKMWSMLLQRTGFVILDSFKFNFTVQAGPDSYTGFLAKKQ